MNEAIEPHPQGRKRDNGSLQGLVKVVWTRKNNNSFNILCNQKTPTACTLDILQHPIVTAETPFVDFFFSPLCRGWVEFSNVVQTTFHTIFPNSGPFFPVGLRNTPPFLPHPIKPVSSKTSYSISGVMFGLFPLIVGCIVFNVFTSLCSIDFLYFYWQRFIFVMFLMFFHTKSLNIPSWECITIHQSMW